jgi:hypothetical protein
MQMALDAPRRFVPLVSCMFVFPGHKHRVVRGVKAAARQTRC